MTTTARHTRKNRRLAPLAGLVACALTGLTACGSGESASGDDAIELTFTTAASEGQAEDWMWIKSEVERRTDGQVTFRDYYSGTLVEATETLQAVQDGRADIGWVTPTYQPTDFPVWYVSQLQYLSDNPEAVLIALRNEYESDSLLTEDFEDSGIHSIGFVNYGPNFVGTSEPVRSLRDLQGNVMRSAGTSDDIMVAASAQPEQMAVNEVYEGLERGTIDGFTQLPFAASAIAGLAEVTSYATDIGSGAYSAAAFGMNQDVWDALPDDVQQVFNDVSEELVQQYFVIQNEIDAEACTTYSENDVELSRLPESEISELQSRVLPELVKSWKQRAEDAGSSRADIDEFFESYTSAIDAAEGGATTYQNPFEACGL